jgi:16S rRNA (uracil1498-N3)-methyltransferase
MHRFFISPENITDAQAILSGEQAYQIAKVLRMKTGDRVIVLDNVGWEYEAAVTAVSPKQVNATIVQKREVAAEPANHITLYMSLLKRDKFEWVLQKCTEVGVSRFVPIVTQRSLLQDVDIKENKMARWQKIIQEAAEQSRRGRMPELCQPMTFAEAVLGVDTAVALIPWESAKETTIRQVLAGKAAETISLFIGPEGGFAEDEIALAQANGIVPVTLGKRILRAETAAIVASSFIMYDYEQ